VEISSLLLLLLRCTFSNSTLLSGVSFQCLVYSVFFFLLGGEKKLSLPRGLCWFIPEVAGGILCDSWCSSVWSSECLPSRFGTGVWQRWKPSCFLSVTWHGEALHGLGVQVVEVLILLAALFPPSVAPASQWGFGVTELMLSASVP
jgi:hypothetical protein